MSKIIKRFRDFSEKYHCFIFDLWGVLYEGDTIFGDALEVLKKLHSLKKPVILISNTPFLRMDCIKNLEQCGLPTELYQTVLTAGDLCFEYVQKQKIIVYRYVPDFKENLWGNWEERLIYRYQYTKTQCP